MHRRTRRHCLLGGHPRGHTLGQVQAPHQDRQDRQRRRSHAGRPQRPPHRRLPDRRRVRSVRYFFGLIKRRSCLPHLGLRNRKWHAQCGLGRQEDGGCNPPARRKTVPGLPPSLGLLTSGEKDEWFNLANKLLYDSGHPAYKQLPGVKYRPSSHAEAKYAAWMQTQRDLKEVTVIINNNKGVCDRKVGTQNCMDAVELILYNDQCMNVFYPGSRTGKRICGMRSR
ncbi:DddA-like double-stranded DNA deaminase toxin [Streptomyces sp. NPDC059881]|uniref:DddA-like double-stranded DNA deaminase toxin n=1 Tax=Streptomyces sp. NPDC059881 TaxID=3346986 RepID=UPI00364C10FF